jgi:polyferredoxin
VRGRTRAAAPGEVPGEEPEWQPPERPDDVPPGYDLTRIPLLAWWLRRPSWQFQLILPTQVLFWVVIVVGFAGAARFDDNFATTLTWYVWFSLVFLLILATGRGWCAVCPFGGLAEWIQRGRFWHGRDRVEGRGEARGQPGLGRPVPEWLSRHGYLTTALMFGVLTWIEEYYQVSDDASPMRTSWTVIGIIVFALVIFLLFERRTFCRYLCPLGGLIGVLGAGAPLTGFRSRDRAVCRRCRTKDCLRGTENAYGCPWFNWPGGSESGVNCGLCGECFRSCRSDNVGLYVERPLAALARRQDRRADVAWTVAVLGGIMIHQHLHETAWWAALDDWATRVSGMPHGPNPVLFVVLTVLYTAVLLLPVRVARHWLYRRPPGGLPDRGTSFTYRVTPFRLFFLPLFYAAVPLLGCDFLAVQLLGFVQGAPKVIPAAERVLGVLSGSSQPATQLMTTAAVVRLQIVVLAAGAAAASAVFWRTAPVEIGPVTRAPRLVRVGGVLLLLLGGLLLAYFYNLTHGAAG